MVPLAFDAAAFTAAAADITAGYTAIIPIALGVMALPLVARRGVALFKGLAK